MTKRKTAKKKETIKILGKDYMNMFLGYQKQKKY